MSNPAISILLPVFNSAEYLKSCIDSILNQTFTSFELIIVNDGSVDNSENIIKSYSDSRIVYIKNETNCGLIYSLNMAIRAAKGKYIARMDGDDIAESSRLELQKRFLDNNSNIGIVACLINFIDENNQARGYWELDQKTLTPVAIKNKMKRESCIAHPSVMGKAELFKKYGYKKYQKNIEDYDLWLRLLNDNIVISKLDSTLLSYRIHNKSITKKDQKEKNVFFKISRCKWRFVYYEVVTGKLSIFVLSVLFWSLLDVIKGIGKEINKAFLNSFLN